MLDNNYPASDNQKKRVLENLLEGLEEFRAGSAVDDTMIAGHRRAHHLTHNNFVVSNHRLRRHRTHRENCGFGRVDYGGELLYAKHTEIANGERCSHEFFRAELAVARAFDQVTNLSGDF